MKYLMPLRLLLFSLFALYNIGYAQHGQMVNATTGTPLGGFGAGAVKFNANNGTFAAMTQPPADAYDFKLAGQSRFQFFSKRKDANGVALMKARTVDGLAQDDAIWPLHLVDFGEVNGIHIKLKAFSPLDRINPLHMSLPYAFFEFTLVNRERTTVEAAIAFQWDDGNEVFRYREGKGIANRSWAVFASSSDQKALLTAGNGEDQDFLYTGTCTGKVNHTLAKTAVKLKLAPLEQKTIRFVLAWYDHTDPDIAFYKNDFKDPETIASYGLQYFNRLKLNADGLVTKFRAANLPAWLKNQTLNTLANLSTNSMYKKDGRVAFSEGQWTCFGTMDQMWHARQIIGQLIPFFAWQELRYWARTQMKNGQIHHDFNQMDVGPSKEKRSILVSWDDTEHADYRNVLKWVDLNCAMIVSTYEIYQMTGDRQQLDFLWPYLKKAGQRIFDQVAQYGNKEFPFTFDHSENSYDAGGDPNVFNANFSAVAYKVMTILAKEKGEIDLVNQYQNAYLTVVKCYADRYLNDQNFKLGKHAESYYGGQWLSFHLQLGEIWNAVQTDFVLQKLNAYYDPFYRGLGHSKGTYDEWTPYILVHYGGLFLHTNRVAQWEKMQKDAYNRQYVNKDFVFDHPLNILPEAKAKKPTASNYKSGNQYISMPGLWRNYYDIIGFHRDKRTNELWLKPVIPSEMNHQLLNALYISPEGYGTLSCKESGKYGQDKEIIIKPETTIVVGTLYLADNFGKQLSVNMNGKPYRFERIGTGYAKEIAVKFNGKIDAKGLKITVKGDAGDPPPALPTKIKVTAGNQEVKSTRRADGVFEAESADQVGGTLIANSKKVGQYVTSCNNFDYIQFFGVDFGKADVNIFFANISSQSKGSSIEIVLDNVAGEAIGTCTIPFTGSDENWTVVSCKVAKVNGIHDVILRFSGTSSDNLMNIDKVTFKNDRETKPFN